MSTAGPAVPAVQPVATAAAAATVPATAAASTAAATKPAASSGGGIVLVKDADLFKSEPNPSWFGNEANPAPGDDASWTNSNWLKSRFHFSFAEHRSGRSNFGPLRVLNDDLVQPNRGFGTHPHANMEIVTYIVDGFLTHKDTMGTAETLTNGDVQFMTAGRGIRHSEHNLNKQRPLRFIQMWFLPRRQGLPPNYGSMKGDASARRNKWHHILTDVRSDVDDTDVPIKINQDVNMFVTELEASRTLPYEVAAGRQVYLLCLHGTDVALAEDKHVSSHDAAMVRGGESFVIRTSEAAGASFLLIDVPESKA